MKKKISVLDTTLRDGAQGETISFSVSDKIKIAHELDLLGIDYIEGGNPYSNETDRTFFNKIRNEKLTSEIVAFGSTRRKNVSCEKDGNLRALTGCGAKTVVIFGKCSDKHVKNILKATEEENLSMISDSISYLKAHGLKVIFDAEHYFDGLKSNKEYAVSVIKCAEKSGADIICLCDTNGGCLPDEIENGVKTAKKAVETELGIHCHNDSALAVANTVVAVKAGVTHIQGTLLGCGERCGNADLSAVLPDIEFKTDYTTVGEENMAKLFSVCRRVAAVANITLPKLMPYIGSSAFAHKGGMHIDAVLKQNDSFEHISPELVGNERRFLFSEMSGKSALLRPLQKLRPDIGKNDDVVSRFVYTVKKLESMGYTFESAEGSIDLIARKVLGIYNSRFSLDDFKITENYPAEVFTTSADVTITVSGEKRKAKAMGTGPIHALDNAIRTAIVNDFPSLRKVHLVDYKVRVMNPESSTAASVAVLIDSTDGEKQWSTVSASSDVIQASAFALCDSYDYYLQNS